MKKEEIDQLIEESLSKDEAQFYHDLDEQGMLKQWGGLYSGKLGKWAILITTVQLIATVFTFWAGYNFFTSIELQLTILWGAGMFIGLIMIAQMKLWHWMQMDKNTILQEMKRIEFQVAILMEKLNEQKKV
ncbi:MAG: hypothetical protein BalsKO_04870 [Balneolaceae bacterium]